MKFGICSIIKNEARYLEEWIRWNLEIGFNEIHLYEDHNSQPHKEITDKFEQVTLHSIDEVDPNYQTSTWDNTAWTTMGCGRQVRLFKWFADTNPYDMDWCAFIDGDEFINFEEGWDLEKLCTCDKLKDSVGIFLFWKMMDSNGHIERPEGGLVKNYTHEATQLSYNDQIIYKSLVNMRKCGNDTCWHTMHELAGSCNTAGFTCVRFINYHKAFIRHYMTKSWRDWCDRFLFRGEEAWCTRKLPDFFVHNEEMKDKEKELYDLYDTWKEQLQ